MSRGVIKDEESGALDAALGPGLSLDGIPGYSCLRIGLIPEPALMARNVHFRPAREGVPDGSILE